MLNVAVFFGGRSCEHEISIISAIQVMQTLHENYHVIAIYLSKDGDFYSSEAFMDIEYYQKEKEIIKKKDKIYFIKENNELYCAKNWFKKERIDLVVPVLHGTNGEDGSVQGFLELWNVPYVGSSVLASALAQSKITTKKLLQYHQIPTLPFVESKIQREEAPYIPCIIKPDRLGSSIGIQVVKTQEEWCDKNRMAFVFDERVLVEPYLNDFIEINCSVMKVKNEIVCSHLEQVQKQEEILSFKDKYQSKQGKVSEDRIIDPILEESMQKEIYEIAKKVYEIFAFNGVIRIDFIIENHTIYVNEINTIPGSYAYYLWGEQDLLQILETVIEEAIQNYKYKQEKISSFESDVLFHFHGNKT